MEMTWKWQGLGHWSTDLLIQGRGNDVEMTWKWHGNDMEMTWKWQGLGHWSTDPLIHWSTDLQSCKCSWGEIWEIWGAILVQMALIFLTRCTSFLQLGGAKDKTSWRQNRNIFTETNTWQIFRQIFLAPFINMYLEICIWKYVFYF